SPLAPGGLLLSGGGATLAQRLLSNADVATHPGSFTLLVNNAATIVNLAGATWDFQGDGRIVPNNGPVGLFTNQGTLKKSAGTGTANISITLSSAGLVQVPRGILSFSGSFAVF